jgi:hypothetical protein
MRGLLLTCLVLRIAAMNYDLEKSAQGLTHCEKTETLAPRLILLRQATDNTGLGCCNISQHFRQLKMFVELIKKTI